MNSWTRFWWLALPLLLACQLTPWQKVSFDIRQISPEGLVGQSGSLRSFQYEFCLPDTQQARTEVQAIDPTVQLSHSRGRIGCRPDQLLAIGSTHQANWKTVLEQLVQRSYIDRIDPFWGE